MEYRDHTVWTGLPYSATIISKSARVAQDYLVNSTDLKIPAFIQSEGLHGFLASNATIFSSPIAIACAFNPGLVEDMASVIATEAKAHDHPPHLDKTAAPTRRPPYLSTAP
jgi:beta-glucosidase